MEGRLGRRENGKEAQHREAGEGGGTEKRKDKSGLRRGARSKQWKGIGREREKKEEE